jgi:hypothetical protein
MVCGHPSGRFGGLAGQLVESGGTASSFWRSAAIWLASACAFAAWAWSWRMAASVACF